MMKITFEIDDADITLQERVYQVDALYVKASGLGATDMTIEDGPTARQMNKHGAFNDWTD